jgi:tRNA/tmRNA/rRNA uracil-C5-methylase (TrmA/RlmC/RlmD family)
LVITDPPRRGLSRTLRDDLARWKPKRILMLGCDPATWARDAAHLVDHGYRVTELELFDLFPLTHHVEILALLVHTSHHLATRPGEKRGLKRHDR